MSELIFREPKKRAPRRDARDWTSTIETLKANAGSFAVIAQNEAHRQLASTINGGKNKAFTAGEFEATSEKAETGEGFDILARYVGAEAPAESVQADAVTEPEVAAEPETPAAPLVESTPVADDSDDWS